MVCGQNANRTKCQPDIMPTKGWHFVRPFFSGWHFVRPNFLVGILSGPSQHVLAFCPIGPSRCEMSFSILFIQFQYPTHLGQQGPPMGIKGQIWLKMAILGAFQGPKGHFWWTHKGLVKMGPLQTKFLTQMCPFNFWDLNQINLIYALLLQIQLCCEHALFEGHFWPKFCDGGH